MIEYDYGIRGIFGGTITILLEEDARYWVSKYPDFFYELVRKPSEPDWEVVEDSVPTESEATGGRE